MAEETVTGATFFVLFASDFPDLKVTSTRHLSGFPWSVSLKLPVS
jgi:hypothetical protein